MSEAVMTLKDWRNRAALSQRELAAASGTDYTTIARLEMARNYPWPRTRRKIAQALGLDPWQIAWRSSEP